MELAYHFARFEELGWLLDDGQQRRVLELDADFYEGDRGNWGLVNAQLYAMRDSRRSRGRTPTRPSSPRRSPSERRRTTRSSMPCAA